MAVAGERGGMTGGWAPSGLRGGTIGAGVMVGGGASWREGAAAFPAAAGGGGTEAFAAAGGGAGVLAAGAGAAAGAAGLASASSPAKVNLGLPEPLPLVSVIFTSARWRAACTRCSARRSCASRWAFSFSASFSPAAADGAAAAEPRGGAALTPGRGAMGAGFTDGRAELAAGAAGAENSSAMRGMSLPAPMPRRSRQLRLSVPLLEF